MAAIANNPSKLFDSLSRNLSVLAYAKSENDKITLKRILDEFVKINYSESWTVVNERAVLVINQCCFLVSHDDEQLVQNVLHLFYNLLAKQKVVVEGKTLSVAITWVLDCVKRKKSEQIKWSLLVLQELVRGRSYMILDQTDKILEMCRQLMTEYCEEEPPQICYFALNCVESLVSSKEEDKFADSIVPKSCDIFLKFLYEEIPLKNPIWNSKCLVTTMHGLSHIAERDINLIMEILPEIFGSIKGYMLYGIQGMDGYKIDKVQPLNIALPEEMKPSQSQTVKKSIGKYDRRSKKKNPTPISNIIKEEDEPSKSAYTGFQEMVKFYVTSDSDFSESEGGNNGKLRHLASKVRRCSLILLGTLLMKGDLKNLTRFLPSFLWDGSQTRTLITCLLKDPSASVRSEVLTVLSMILTKFKPFMSLADNSTKSSFTSISNDVAEILKNLHKSLTTALKNENYKIVTNQILKTISDLVRCSPYHKLEENLLTDLAKEVAESLKRKDVNVQIASLVVFGCIASINPQSDEVKKIVFGTEKVWLFEQCSKMLNDETNFNTAVAVECLQVLAALVRNFPSETILALPNDVIKLLEFSSNKQDFYVRLYAAKLTEAVANALQMSVGKEDSAKRMPVDLAASMWKSIIHGPLTCLIQSEDQPALRSAACNCFASLAITNETVESSLIFDELPRGDQIICITHLFGCAKDEEPQVRSAAIRALAVLVQFPKLRQDSLFFLDAADLFFTASKDENVHVRIQAAWLFRHIAEAALANLSEGLDDDLSDMLILRLLDAGVRLSRDQKKGKPYAVRGISNLLLITTDEIVTKRKEEIHNAVDALVLNATSGTFMKARWNSCYALGAVLAHKCVCLETRSKIFPALFDLVQNYKNFKVRISAGHALASAKDRESYGDFFLPTWRALVIALENAEHMADFSEYQHRDNLVDQLCSCMCHLVSIIELADLIPLQEILLHYVDHLNHQFQRFKNRIVPEKGSNIVDADSRLSELQANDSLTRDQKNALTHLSSLFVYNI